MVCAPVAVAMQPQWLKEASTFGGGWHFWKTRGHYWGTCRFLDENFYCGRIGLPGVLLSDVLQTSLMKSWKNIENVVTMWCVAIAQSCHAYTRAFVWVCAG